MTLVEVLRTTQKQCDPGGIEVRVSRQAVDEAADEIERLTAEVSHWKERYIDLNAKVARALGQPPVEPAGKESDSCKHEWCDIATGGQYCRLCDYRKERTEDIFIDDGGMAYDE